MTFKPNVKDSPINQKYYRVEGDKTIAKVTVAGVDRYELWRNKQYLGYENSFDEAVNKFRSLENGR